METQNSRTIFLVIWMITFYLIAVPSIMYYLRCYYHKRHNPIIQKRYYRIVIAINIILVILIVFDKTIYIISLSISDNPTHVKDPQNELPYKLNAICSSVYALFTPTVGFMFLGRTYLLYYDMQWMLASNKGQWVQFITHNNQMHTNKYLKYRQTLGNARYIFIRILLPICFMISVLLLGTRLISDGAGASLLILIYMILLTLCLVVYCKIPPHNTDLLLIRKEIKVMMQCGLFVVLLTVVHVLCQGIIFHGHTLFFYIAPVTFVYALVYSFVALFSTRWVLIDSGLLDTHVRVVHHMSLIQILSQKVTFELFMNHLLSEFSSEALLCIIECLQWKEFIQAQSNETLLLDPLVSELALPTDDDEFPQSTIVYDAQLELDEKFCLLIEKYIRFNAIYQVNISYRPRDQLNRVYVNLKQNLVKTKLTDQELLNVFDEVIHELLVLLNDSRNRFMRSTRYKQLTMDSDDQIYVVP
eukprot:253837_1